MHSLGQIVLALLMQVNTIDFIGKTPMSKVSRTGLFVDVKEGSTFLDMFQEGQPLLFY